MVKLHGKVQKVVAALLFYLKWAIISEFRISIQNDLHI